MGQSNTPENCQLGSVNFCSRRMQGLTESKRQSDNDNMWLRAQPLKDELGRELDMMLLLEKHQQFLFLATHLPTDGSACVVEAPGS